MSVPVLPVIFGCAYVIGFIAAIPVGATQLEVARRALAGHLASALFVMAGSISSDFTYGVIGFFGLAPFLQLPWVIAVFLSVGSVLSIGLGIWVVRTSGRKTHTVEAGRVIPSRGLSYVTGFSLAFTNPLMMAWWLLGAKLLGELHLATVTSTGEIFAFLIGGVMGIGSYHVVLATTVRRAKRFLTPETVRRTTVVFGVALVGIGIYLAVRFLLIVTG